MPISALQRQFRNLVGPPQSKSLSDPKYVLELVVASLPAIVATGLGSYLLSAAVRLRPKVPPRRAPRLTSKEPYPANIFEGGHDLETPLGKVRYYEFGPEEGEKILLVHGITTPTPVWREVGAGLAKAGYRVLTFDLYGRGYSDSPHRPHDTSLFLSQITYLLTALPRWDTFHLAGMSLGGGIVSNYAHYFPQRIRKLILICPAGATPRSSLSLGKRFFTSQFLSTGPSKALAQTINIGLPLSPQNPLVFWQANNHPGFFFSFFSSLRDGPIYDQADVMRKVIRSFGDRITAIWGDQDSVVPMDTIKFLGEEGALLKEKTTVIAGGEHFIVATRPQEVLEAMLRDLKA